MSSTMTMGNRLERARDFGRNAVEHAEDDQHDDKGCRSTAMSASVISPPLPDRSVRFACPVAIAVRPDGSAYVARSLMSHTVRARHRLVKRCASVPSRDTSAPKSPRAP
jgi:hypothetical protein